MLCDSQVNLYSDEFAEDPDASIPLSGYVNYMDIRQLYIPEFSICIRMF